jgi:tRNA(Ile)-lysidine synthase
VPARSTSLPRKVLRTIEHRRLLDPREWASGLSPRVRHVVVACSGGPDSTALLDVLVRLRERLGVTISVASVDHGLRPEAERELALVHAHCERLGVTLQIMSLHVEPGANLMARARDARYHALIAHLRGFDASCLAVGHTMDDQAETVLSRILRGSGLRGLRGIDPKREDGVIRPLMDCRRDEILVYLKRHGLSYALDPSNDNRRFERSRLRHDVLARLQSEHPHAVAHLAQLADEAREIIDSIQMQARDALRHMVVELGGHADDLAGGVSALRMSPLRSASLPVAREILRQWLARYVDTPLGRAHMDQILGAVRQASRGKSEVWLSSAWCVVFRPNQDRVVLRSRSLREAGAASAE